MEPITVDSQNHEIDRFLRSFFSKGCCDRYGWSPSHIYPAHVKLIEQDTPAATVFLIESGLVKLSRLDRTGHEIIAGLRRRNWLISAPSVLLGKPTSFTVTTLVDSSLRYIHSFNFLRLTAENPEFSKYLLLMFSQEVFRCTDSCLMMSCLPAHDRLEELLLQIAFEIEQSPAGKEVTLHVPLKHWELAQMIAVTPEHLSRLLARLEHEGTIRREKGIIVLKKIDSLRQAAHGCS